MSSALSLLIFTLENKPISHYLPWKKFGSDKRVIRNNSDNPLVSEIQTQSDYKNQFLQEFHIFLEF